MFGIEFPLNYHYNREVGHWVPNRDELIHRLLDRRNVGDIDFYREARSGRLNRDEYSFTNVSS